MKTNSQVLLLGIPFDNLTLSMAVRKILEMARRVNTIGEGKLVATVNVDFLTNTLSWLPSKAPRHPELLDILRQADLVTADGMPLVWLSRLLKFPLQERVAGSDLVPALAEAASKNGQRVFFLGGQGYVAQRAAEKLKQQFPQLNVAGVYAPFVYSEGEKMLDSEQDDKKIVELINQSDTDILLIGFGNPKQELFFQRNRYRLKVGVAIGVGGTFEFITGRVSRAPLWMQKAGLEWIYRISQDPLRLWKRYALGLAKLGAIVIPLVLYSRLSELLRLNLRKQHTAKQPFSNDFSNNNRTEMDNRVVLSEQMLSQGDWEGKISETKLYQGVGFSHSTNGPICFDFSQVKSIQPQAMAGFVRLLKKLHQKQFSFYFKGLNNKHVIQSLKLNRIWDIFSMNSANMIKTETYEKGEEKLNMNANCALSIVEKNDQNMIASITGRLDANAVNSIDINNWLGQIGELDCILDLSKLQFVDSTGLRTFFQIHKKFDTTHTRLVLCGVSETIKQLMEITRVSDLFQISDTIASAKQYRLEENMKKTVHGNFEIQVQKRSGK